MGVNKRHRHLYFDLGKPTYGNQSQNDTQNRF